MVKLFQHYYGGDANNGYFRKRFAPEIDMAESKMNKRQVVDMIRTVENKMKR